MKGGVAERLDNSYEDSPDIDRFFVFLSMHSFVSLDVFETDATSLKHTKLKNVERAVIVVHL